MQISMEIRKLYFCAMCGACCRWPGIVRMNDAEIDQVADSFGMTPDAFINAYMDITPDRHSLTLISKGNDDCIFFDAPNCCHIYPLRPTQCRSFPNKWDVPDLESRCSSICLRYRKCMLTPDDPVVLAWQVHLG